MGANESAPREPAKLATQLEQPRVPLGRAIVVSRRIRQELADPRYPAVNPLRTCYTAAVRPTRRCELWGVDVSSARSAA